MRDGEPAGIHARMGARLLGFVIASLVAASCADPAGDVGQVEAAPDVSASSSLSPSTTPSTSTTPSSVGASSDAGSAEAIGLRIDVSPTRGLLDGQEVELVLATDLVDILGAAICLEDHVALGIAACDLGTVVVLDGEGSTMMTARRFLTVQNTAFDCAKDRCVLGVGTIDGSSQVMVQLHFAGAEAPPEPDLQVLQPERVITDVRQDLGFRELVQVTIEGPFDRHAPSVAQCVVDDFRYPMPSRFAPSVDSDLCWNHIGWNGRGDGDTPIREIEQVEFNTILTSNWAATDVGPSEPVDCRVQACELIVSDGHRLLDRIPLEFASDGPWPGWQSGAASPREYRTGDTVRVTVDGLRPKLSHTISQCVHFDRYAVTCVPVAGETIDTDATGSGFVDLQPTASVDGHGCGTECWYYVFDPGMPEDVWETRVTVDIELLVD